MGRIPNNESKASYEIKQKAQHPESAQVHASLSAKPKDWVSSVNGYEDWCIRTAQRGFREDNCKGRAPGSRVVWDEKLEIFVLVS